MIDLGTLFVTQHLNESGRPSYMTRKAIVRDTLQWSQWIVLFIQLVRWIRCKCLWKNGAPPDGQQAQSAVASVLALLSTWIRWILTSSFLTNTVIMLYSVFMRDNVLMFGQHQLNPSMVMTLVCRQITCWALPLTSQPHYHSFWCDPSLLRFTWKFLDSQTVSVITTHSQMRAWMHCNVNTLFSSVEACVQLNVTIIFSGDPQPRQLWALHAYSCLILCIDFKV